MIDFGQLAFRIAETTFSVYMCSMSRLITTSQFLEAYSAGSIGSHEAMQGIGVDSFRDLLNAMADGGHSLPRGRGREKQIAREIAEALPLLTEALEPEAPDPVFQ